MNLQLKAAEGALKQQGRSLSPRVEIITIISGVKYHSATHGNAHPVRVWVSLYRKFDSMYHHKIAIRSWGFSNFLWHGDRLFFDTETGIFL